MKGTIKILDPNACWPLRDSDYIEVDVGDYWRKVTSRLDKMKVEVTRPFFWQVMLSFLEPNEDKAIEFKKHFWTPEAKNIRLNAVYGAKVKGHLKELLIYRAVHLENELNCPNRSLLSLDEPIVENEDLERLIDIDGVLQDPSWKANSSVLGNEGLVIGRDELTQYLIELVVSKDLAGIERLKEVVEYDGKLNIEGNDQADRWLHFCFLLKGNQCLPTKKKIQETWNPKNNQQASKWRKDLGLNGLPSHLG